MTRVDVDMATVDTASMGDESFSREDETRSNPLSIIEQYMTSPLKKNLVTTALASRDPNELQNKLLNLAKKEIYSLTKQTITAEPVLIKESLTPEQEMVLSQTFPSSRVNFIRSVSNNHAFAAAHRKLEERMTN